MKIHNTASIAILMATYNGERYLREQIHSLQRQTCRDWTLYIQDDGSTDSTIDIINEMAKSDSRIIRFDIGLSRQGAGMNFMSMLNVIESDYYMFCDQDDVWFERKIEMTFRRMKDVEMQTPNKPIIVHTSRTFTDADLNVRLQSEFNPRNQSDEKIIKKIDMMKNPNILRIYTIVIGCTMMLNRAVKDVVFPYCSVRLHDIVCAMAVANSGGVISTIIEPTMFYRLHSNQTCGVQSNRILPKLLSPVKTLMSNLLGFHLWKIYGGGISLSSYFGG